MYIFLDSGICTLYTETNKKMEVTLMVKRRMSF